jgi:acyl-CoA synthetase (AMP-forming)/AMP-acid ligase II
VDYLAMAQRVQAQVPGLDFIVGVRTPAPLEYATLLSRGREDDAALHFPAPDAVKLVMYTSGTTGPAKGVLHSHRTLPFGVDSAVRRWGWKAGDTVLMPSPVTHVTGYCIGLEMPFSLGTTTVLMERWNAEEAIELIQRHRITGTVGATPFLQELCEAAERAGCGALPMRTFACGGAAVPSDLIVRADRILEGYACRVYGATESPLVTYGRMPEEDPRVGAVTDGRIADYHVRLVDGEEHDVPGGGEGEILVRGAGLFLGYVHLENTRESFTADGFFRTGDIGVRAADGTLTITGRKKDLIIRGGENLSAKEIEDVLHAHPLIVEAAVVSAPHPRLGETLAAYLRTRDGATLNVEQVAAHVRGAGLAPQKCPEHVRIVTDLPRTPSGKIRKDRLRAMIRAELG